MLLYESSSKDQSTMKKTTRREAIGGLTATALLAATGCRDTGSAEAQSSPLLVNPIQSVSTLPSSGPWPTVDPFLFCVHHNDHYPEGNEACGPKASLSGRKIGRDFANKDGWNMYHGETIGPS